MRRRYETRWQRWKGSVVVGVIGVLALSAVGVLVWQAIVSQASELPRWAVLARDEVNLRTGPHKDYQLKATYHARDMPVRLLRRFAGWSLIADVTGDSGWVLDSMVNTRLHTAWVLGSKPVGVPSRDASDAPVPMHGAADGASAVLWQLQPGVIGTLGPCRQGWCVFEVDGRRGFVAADRLWGAGAP